MRIGIRRVQYMGWKEYKNKIDFLDMLNFQQKARLSFTQGV